MPAKETLTAQDNGYGDLKGYFKTQGFEEGEGYSIPALLSSPINLPGGSELTATNVIDDLYMNYRGTDYWLGNKARNNRNRTVNMDPNKLSQEDELVKLLGSLGYVNHLTEGKNFKVVTGIPVQQYNYYKNVLTNSWSGTFRFTFRGKELDIKISAVKPIAQGAGVYYDLSLDDNSVLDNDIFGKNVLVFDMGSKTTNIVPMIGGQYLGDMAHTVWTGVSNIHINLQEILQQKHGLTYDLADISNVVRNGYYLFKGNRYPIDQEIQDASEAVIDKVITEAQIKIDLARDVETVVFASGGACIRAAANMFESKMRNFVFNVRTVADPLSNVRGYWKCGNFLEQLGKF